MKIIPDKDDLGQRLDRYLRKIFPNAKLGEIYEILRNKKVLVNGKKIPESSRLREGDTIEILLAPETTRFWKTTTKTPTIPVTQKLDEKRIIYQDEDIFVYNKPSWLIVHSPDHKTDETSLIDQIDDYLEKKWWQPQGTFSKPALAHRIDRDTSGLIIACLNRRSYEYMAELFRTRKIQKTYEALVVWVPDPVSWKINTPLFRQDTRQHEAKMIVDPRGDSALTNYEVIQKDTNELWSLVKLQPKTGRTHQIRAHMAHIGHPLIWDRRYGGNSVTRFPELKNLQNRFGHLLHASELEFIGPDGQKRHFISPSNFLKSASEK